MAMTDSELSSDHFTPWSASPYHLGQHGCVLGVILGQALGSKQAMKLHLEHLSSFRSGFSKTSKRDSRRKQFGTQERVSTVLKVTCL
jgi:hypothetical protein